MRIRKARGDDFQSCLPLFEQLWPGFINSCNLMELEVLFCELLKSPTAELFVAEENRKIIAFMDVTFRETIFYQGKTMIIEDIVVDKSLRRRGIGAELIRYAEELARKRGCRAIELSSDLYRKETHKFWKNLGYECKAYQFRKIID